MNEQKLIQNVIEQIKEAQLKLGAEKEVIRLYFPMASMNVILGTHYTDEQEMLTALRTNKVFDTTVLGRLKFFIHEGRFEVRVPGCGVCGRRNPRPAFSQSNSRAICTSSQLNNRRNLCLLCAV